MDYQLIVDSCVDFNEDVFPQKDKVVRIPFKINIDGEEFIDENLDLEMLRAKMKASKENISSSCPSPHDFLEAYKKSPVNFVVTITKKASGTYQSAMIAKDMLKDAGLDNEVYVFNSLAASAGETLVAMKIVELIDAGNDVATVVEKTNAYIENVATLFLPVSINNLQKSGRIVGLKAAISKLLKIIPIVGADETGEIVLKKMTRGDKQSLETLYELVEEEAVNQGDNYLGISHVNNLDKALKIKETIEERFSFKDIFIFETGGLSTIYADDGGIVLGF